MSERPRSRAWLVFFAVLALLVAGALSLETWYNLHQQLTPDAVEQARALWRERGPADYDLKYTVILQRRSGVYFQARARAGAVTDVQVDGVPLEPELYPFHDLKPLFAEVEGDAAERDVTAVAPDRSRRTYLALVRRGQPVRAWCDDEPVPASAAASYGMESLFAGLARLLEHDRAAGGWPPYSVAMFDRADGHLLHYVRSRMRTRERLEFSLMELKPVPERRAAQAPSPP